MTICPCCAEEISEGTTRCACGGWPTWATVLLSALAGGAVAALGVALVMRQRPAPAAAAPVAPPAPPPLEVAIAPEAPPPPAAPRSRRSRRRKATPDPER